MREKLKYFTKFPFVCNLFCSITSEIKIKENSNKQTKTKPTSQTKKNSNKKPHQNQTKKPHDNCNVLYFSWEVAAFASKLLN